MNKSLMSVLALTTVGLMSFTCISCGGDDDSSGGGSGGNNPVVENLSKANIADASILFVAPSDYLTAGGSSNKVSRRAGSDDYVLFKTKKDGSSEKVIFYNKDGSEASCNVSRIIKSEEGPYILLFLRTYVQGKKGSPMPEYNCLLANKATGALYKAPDVLSKNLTYDRGTKILKTDKKGNLYYTNGRVHKIDVSNPNNITDEALTPESDFVGFRDFYVSSNGELLYNGHRLRNTQGRLFNIAEIGESFYRGLNGNLRLFLQYAIEDRACYGIFEIEFQSDGNYQLKEIQAKINTDFYAPRDEYWIVTLPNKILRINTDGKTLIMDSTNPADYAANLDWPPTNIVGNDLWGPYQNIFNISDLQYNNSYIYCCGIRNNTSYSLLRTDINTNQCETVIQDNNYEIYSFTVNSDDSVTFTGLRMSDGKNVLVTIDKNGTIINEKVTSTNDKIVLERIN